MRSTRALILGTALASLAMLATAAGAPAGDAEAAGGSSARLQAFGTCGQLLGYVKGRARPLVRPWGLGSSVARGAPVPATALPAAAAEARDAGSPTPEYSTTNVQEQGVDEPDIVKSNGSTIFVLQGSTVRAVDVTARKPRLVGSLEVAGGYGAELLLSGDRLLVLSRGGGWIEPLPAATRAIAPIMQSQSVLTEVDVGDPSAMKVVRTLTLEDSSYVSARLVGSTARVVASSSMPHEIAFQPPRTGTPDAAAAALARNRAAVSRSGVKKWLPSYTVKRRGAKAAPERSLVQCRHVYRPASFSGLGLLTVLTIDLSKGLEPVDSDAILTDGRIVYASPESLYVATERWADRPLPARPTEAPDSVTTAIHKFDISDPAKTQYRGTGQVPGFLLNQWSLSEYGGDLRVASTEAPAWWEGVQQRDSESMVSVLREREGKLVTVGSVAGLGKGERIYAVRFEGDVGYVVTFRQVDPLYTLDLSNPERPAVMGELELEGYSAYLHPVGDDLVLGIGQDASPEGRIRGTQLQLFDVSNLRNPVRLAHKVIGPGSSEAEYDHHAFLFWPKTGLVAVPVQTYSPEPTLGETPFVGAIGFRVGRQSGVAELGRITHETDGGGAAPIRRSLVVGDALYTVSDAGVQANGLATLAGLGWAAFPSQAPVVQGGGGSSGSSGGTVPSTR